MPLLILGLVGGALADAVDRRSLVRAATGGQALAAIGLVVQAAADNRSVTLLALVAAQAGCAALGAPARRTFPVRLLPADPVSAEVWNYNVGGMRVLRHWLNYRQLVYGAGSANDATHHQISSRPTRLLMRQVFNS